MVTAAMKLKDRRKNMTKLDSILRSRDITLPTKVHIIKAMVFPVVVCGCESWTIKKAERDDTWWPPAPPPKGLLTHLLALSHLVPAFRSIPLGLVVPASSCHNRLQEDPKTPGTLSPRPQLFSVTFGGKA